MRGRSVHEGSLRRCRVKGSEEQVAEEVVGPGNWARSEKA